MRTGLGLFVRVRLIWEQSSGDDTGIVLVILMAVDFEQARCNERTQQAGVEQSGFYVPSRLYSGYFSVAGS
jgi:hypothetical protein